MATNAVAKRKTNWTAKTQADLAEALGVSLASIRGWCLQGMPGKPGSYSIPEAIGWLRTEGPWRPKAPLDADGELLLADGDSPGLERYRLAKAQLTELDLAERRGVLVHTSKVREALSRWASLIKLLSESLGRAYGQDAKVAVNETLDECRRVIRDEFGSSDEAPG